MSDGENNDEPKRDLNLGPLNLKSVLYQLSDLVLVFEPYDHHNDIEDGELKKLKLK